jgi:hypothetical protein
MWRKAITGKPGRPKASAQGASARAENNDNIINKPKPKRGTSLAYTLDRLERKRLK